MPHLELWPAVSLTIELGPLALLAAGVCLVLVVGAVGFRARNALRKRASGSGSNGLPGADLAEVARQDAEVVRLLAQGQKIQAIKALRTRTGCGLYEAKVAVESVGVSAPAPAAPAPAVVDLAEFARTDGEIVAAARAGHKIEAIRMLRERASSGLKEAKDAVEAIGPERAD